MNLHDVNKGIKKNKRRRRVGRGPGSGWGKTSGRGHKGQGQLAGWTTHPAFEGGQMPLSRRIPKRGFNNRWARLVKSVNVGDLNEVFADGTEVTGELLAEVGLTPDGDTATLTGWARRGTEEPLAAASAAVRRFAEGALGLRVVDTP